MTTDNASQEASQLTAGQRLRRAREHAGLSVAEVANKQHLRPAVITAIENGDYQQIDSELFLKGYVRAYAAHVGIDADGVVRQLDRELEPLREEKKAQVEANPLVTIERRKRRKKRIARIVVVLLLLAAVFYGGSLYLASQQNAETAMEESGAGETQAPEEASGPESAEPAISEDTLNTPPTDSDTPPTPIPQGGDSGIGVDQDDSGTGMNGSLGEDVTGADPALENSAANGADFGASPETEEPLVADSEPVIEPADETTGGPGPSEPPPESEPMQASAEPRLTATFTDDCWVEVRDADGRTLVAALRRAGETLDVRGEAPLQVVFGAVDAVASVEFAGEEVDLSSRPARNNRVALTLTI